MNSSNSVPSTNLVGSWLVHIDDILFFLDTLRRFCVFAQFWAHWTSSIIFYYKDQIAVRFLYFHQNYWETSHLDFDSMQIYLTAINRWNTEEKNNLLSGQSTWPSCQGGEKSGKAFLPYKALLDARPIVLRSGQARERKERSKKSNLLDLDAPLLSSLIVGLKTRLATSRYCHTQLSDWFLVSQRNLSSYQIFQHIVSV